MTLPDKIKALPLPTFDDKDDLHAQRVYLCGYQDARDAAATLAAEHEARAQALADALKHAHQFITNGIEFGFVRMPDPDTPDAAHDTPGIVADALRAWKESQ